MDKAAATAFAGPLECAADRPASQATAVRLCDGPRRLRSGTSMPWSKNLFVRRLAVTSPSGRGKWEVGAGRPQTHFRRSTPASTTP